MTAMRIFRCGRVEPMQGHRAYVRGGCTGTDHDQAELVSRTVTERLRLSLYASCERAPFGWERGLSPASLGGIAFANEGNAR